MSRFLSFLKRTLLRGMEGGHVLRTLVTGRPIRVGQSGLSFGAQKGKELSSRLQDLQQWRSPTGLIMV